MCSLRRWDCFTWVSPHMCSLVSEMLRHCETLENTLNTYDSNKQDLLSRWCARRLTSCVLWICKADNRSNTSGTRAQAHAQAAFWSHQERQVACTLRNSFLHSCWAALSEGFLACIWRTFGDYVQEAMQELSLMGRVWRIVSHLILPQQPPQGVQAIGCELYLQAELS